MKRALPLLTALLLAPLGALPAAVPWWDNYPLIVQGASADETLALNGDVGFTSDQGDPSWGIYVQKTVAKIGPALQSGPDQMAHRGVARGKTGSRRDIPSKISRFRLQESPPHE